MIPGRRFFSVDVDGTISPGSTTGYFEMIFDSPTKTNVTEVLNSPKIFAKWQITKPAGHEDAFVQYRDLIGYAEMRVPLQTASLRFALLESPDGTDGSWSVVSRTRVGTIDFRDEVIFDPGSGAGLNDDTRFLAVASYFDSGVHSGDIQFIKVAANLENLQQEVILVVCFDFQEFLPLKSNR